MTRPKWISREAIYGANRKTDQVKVDQYLAFSGRFTQAIPARYNMDDKSAWGNCSVKVFSLPASIGSNLNNHSLVCYVEYENVGILIPGDNEAPSWNELLKSEAFRNVLPRVHVLLAPHHGREAGFCGNLFGPGLMNPLLTIISDKASGETSATNLYHQQTRGWKVRYPNGENALRKCVSTRCDGHIDLAVYRSTDGKTYLDVSTELGSGR